MFNFTWKCSICNFQEFKWKKMNLHLKEVHKLGEPDTYNAAERIEIG